MENIWKHIFIIMYIELHGGFLKWRLPNSWMLSFMENPLLTWDDLGVPPFLETPIFSNGILMVDQWIFLIPLDTISDHKYCLEKEIMRNPLSLV
jgi:hypothetical protein